MRAWPLLLIFFAACATTPAPTPTVAPTGKRNIVRKTKPILNKRKPIASATNDALLMKLNQAGVVILDVRSAEEYFNSHIEGARNLDFLKNDFEKAVSKLDKSKSYLLYCASGNRSGKARRFFLAQGLKAETLESFDNLKAQGAPIEGFSP